MNWRLAKYRSWLLPVIWDADEQQQMLTATAEPVTVVHVHYYVPVPALPPAVARKAITEGNQP